MLPGNYSTRSTIERCEALRARSEELSEVLGATLHSFLPWSLEQQQQQHSTHGDGAPSFHDR